MNKHNSSISNSKKIISLFCMLLLLLATFLFFVLSIVPQYSNEYTASLLDKMERLESIKEPKIVLIGNSNLAFGIDSSRIEEAFGMPVVNMGLHGSLGNAFHEEMAKINVHEGDIIIIAHTTYYDDGKIGDPVLAWITLENHWNLWKLVEPKMYLQMVQSFPTYLKRAIKLWQSGTGNQVPASIYARTSFNEYGDVMKRFDDVKLQFDGNVIMPAVGGKAPDRLNRLNQYITDRGAAMLIAAYPIIDGAYTPDRQLYEEFQTELEASMDAPVISDYTDYFLEEKYFYDRNYHLNLEGVAIRTELLINDLKQWMEK